MWPSEVRGLRFNCERDNAVGAGRPTKYKEEYNDQVFKLCLLGATDREIANFFDVDEATVNRWKIEYPEFCESIKRGKIQADTEIAESLYNKAKGYTRDEVKILQYEGEPVIVPYKAYYPPDTAAINIWLKNRRGKVKDEDGQRWADKQEIDHTTKGESIKPLDTSKLTLEEKQILLKAIRSQKDGGD